MTIKNLVKQTGYKFRPGCNNPYFKMDDIEAEVLTETALTEKVQKRRVKKGDKVNDDRFITYKLQVYCTFQTNQFNNSSNNNIFQPEQQNLLDGSDDEDTIFETDLTAKV